VDPVREFLGDRYFDKAKLATLQPDLGGLHALAQAGQFEQLVAVSEIVMQGLARIPPHERLAVRHARLVAFLRLRKHDFANAELEEIGELDRAQYLYETYPAAYPDGRSGSFVPFSLRVLKAEMPARLSSERTSVDDTVDALLALRGWCRAQADTGDADLWGSRDDLITDRLVAHATAAQEVDKALSLMKEQAEHRPTEQQSRWLAKLGRVYLQYGQLTAAEDAFSRAEAYSSGGDEEDIAHELNGARALACLPPLAGRP
jgi:tetratricopeptide (TPR) repeat protein